METTDSTTASDGPTRTTAPQSQYSMREVWIGLIVTLIGSIIVFGIPIINTI